LSLSLFCGGGLGGLLLTTGATGGGAETLETLLETLMGCKS
jgi:hypothetical protein